MAEKGKLSEIHQKTGELAQNIDERTEFNENNKFIVNVQQMVRQSTEKVDELRQQLESWKKDYDEQEKSRTHEMESIHKQLETLFDDKRSACSCGKMDFQVSFTINVNLSH